MGVLALAAAGPAYAGVPGYIRHHGIAAVERSHVVDPDGRLRVRVHALGRTLDLALEPSPILAAGAETVTIDEHGVHREPSRPLLYRGHLADDPSASVRVALSETAIIGSVTDADDTWFFEPLHRYDKSARKDATFVYRASDIDASAVPPGSCAADAAPLPATPNSTFPAPSAGLSVSGSPMAAAGGSIELSVVADYQFYASHGENSAAYMQAIIDQVAAFYPASIGMAVSIVQTVVYTSPGLEPLTTSTASGTLLSSLAQARFSQPTVLGAGDITHLFTGRNLDSSIIGIAYVGTVCDRSYAASIAQDYNSSLHMMTLLAGHELGHSVGASHDGQSGSPCSATAFGYVMWPSISSSLAEQFSTCSSNTIAPVLATATCLGGTPSTCGDGIVQTGEECDDGGQAGADCCRSDCRLDTIGTTCTDDGNICTGDVCGADGICLHPDRSAVCLAGDACTTEGQCSGGVCVSVESSRPLVSPDLKARFGEAIGDDALTVRSTVGAVLASLPTAGGATIRFLDDNGGLLHESFAPASAWLNANNAGRTFRFLADATLAPQTGGLSWMLVRFRPLTAMAKVKAKFSGTELPFLEGRSSVGLQILIGDPVSGDCGTTFAMTCGVTSTRISCS